MPIWLKACSELLLNFNTVNDLIKRPGNLLHLRGPGKELNR